MDERTKVLIYLGAATAANCIPCFEDYFGKAKAVGLTSGEIGEAVDLASQVKKGAHLAIRNRISDRMGGEKMSDLCPVTERPIDHAVGRCSRIERWNFGISMISILCIPLIMD